MHPQAPSDGDRRLAPAQPRAWWPRQRRWNLLRSLTATICLTAALAVVGGCAVVPRAGDSPLLGEALSGRLAVKVDGVGGGAARSVSAAFVLQGDAQTGKLDLATPLGSVLAQARWSAGEVVLATPRGEKRFASLDALIEEILGEGLPVAALFDWLRGRPWPGAVSIPTGNGFEQLGWAVDLAGFDSAAAVDARRLAPPTVTVRARMDRSS